MRHLRTLIVALSTIIAVLGTAIVGAAPANAAIGTSYNVWNVRRNADSNRILHLGAWASGSLTVTANVKASRLATLATGDVVEIRLETPGGVFREIHTSGGFTTNVVGHGLSGMNESTTLKVAEPLATYNITFSGEISAASTGDVTVTPVLYVNNVRSGNAVTTDFDFAVGQWSAQATLVYTTDTYTVTANDFVVTTTTSICADLSAVSAGQALTATGTIKKDSTATGGASTATYIQDGVTSAATITNPKPTKSLVASLVNQYMYSSGDEGKVLSWANDKAIKAAGTDVAGSCFNHAATENTSGLNIWLTGLDTYVKQVSMMYNVSLMCDVVDQATSRPTTSSRNILMQQATQACYTESIQVGKTYDVRFKIFLTNGQTLIDSWTRTWTPTEPADITPPVLTGTAPDAAKYESVDNSTNAIVLGSLGTVTGNDGNAGQLVVTRQSDTTMRISQWGPTGGIAIGTGNYIDFTAPRTDAFRSGEAPWYGNSRTQVSWYGNFDKWVYSQSDAENLEFVVGTTTSNTATHATLTMSALSDACTAKAGAGFTANLYNYGKFKLVGAQNSKPLFTATCYGSIETGSTDFDVPARTYLFELNVNGANSTATAITQIDSVGEVNADNPNYFSEPNTMQCSIFSAAHNRKANPTGTDPVLIFAAVDRDKFANAGCNFGEEADTVVRVETTMLLANGTVVRKTDASAISGKFADKVQAINVAFDSLGNVKLLLTSTTNPSNSTRDFTLYDIPTSGTDQGKIVNAKSLTMDSETGFTNANPSMSGLILANGVGNTEALYALRVELGAATAGATINLTSGAITTGESLSVMGNTWTWMVGYYALQDGNIDGESNGGVNYYVRTTQTKYSVIHWLPGIDPALGPVISSNATFTVTSGSTTVGTLTSTAGTASWAITGGANSNLFNINASTGALTFKNAATPGTYVVEVTVTDTANGNKTATQTITITVPDTTAPTVTVNQSPTVSTTSTTVVTPSANESVTWSITGGAQQNDFDINPSTGAVTFKNAMPAGTYVVEITATDGSGNTTVKTITVTVADGPDTTAPTVTVPDTTPEVNPGDTTVEDLSADENVTWSITGGANRTLFQINPSTGLLEFKDPAAPGTYTVIVTAEDGAGNKTNKTITVTVPAAPVAPTINVSSPIDVRELSSGNMFALSSNQTVDWEIVTTSGISSVTIVDGHVYYNGTIFTDLDGATITLRATNPDTGLVTTKVITLNVVPLTLTANGSVNSNGSGSYTINSNDPNYDENLVDIIEIDNPAVTNAHIVNGVLTFDVDPNYTGTVVFTVCAAPSEGCLLTKTITLHLGAVSAPSTATRYITSSKSTTISWSAATNAVRYVVKKNGKVICRTTATSCTYKGVLGPKQRITLTAIGGNGSTATITVGQSSSRFGLLSRVTNFDIFGSKLDWKKRYQLNQIAKAIKAAGFTKIRLIGNTDDIGSSKVDRALSLARAKVVKAYLSSLLKGVTFTIDAAGRTNPIKSNAKVINRKYNRRVDIFAA